MNAPSRREEVEASIKWIMSAGISGGAITPNMRDLARTLADEVDERDAVITKLLAMLEPMPDDSPLPYWKAHCDECGWFGLSSSCELERYEAGDCDVLCPLCHNTVDEMGGHDEARIAAIHARACEIAGRKE